MFKAIVHYTKVGSDLIVQIFDVCPMQHVSTNR